MSSSRGDRSEESILARLEQTSGRGLGTDMSPLTKGLLYTSATVLVVLLVVTLGWLARDSSRQDEALLAAHAIQVVPVQPSAGIAGHESTPIQDEPAQAQGAAVIETEEPAAPETAPAVQPAPPLVLLKPAESAVLPGPKAAVQQPETAKIVEASLEPDAAATPPATVVAEATPATAVAQAQPPKVEAEPGQAKAAAPSAPATALKPPAQAKAVKAAAAKARSRAEPARGKHGAKAVAKAAKRPAASAKPAARKAVTVAKAARTTPSAAPAEAAPVDTDVALISALIAHSGKRPAQRNAAPACGSDKKCGAKSAAQH